MKTTWLSFFIFWAIAVVAHAQSPPKDSPCPELYQQSVGKLNPDFTYAKTFSMVRKNGETAVVALVMSEGSTYDVRFSIKGGDKAIAKGTVSIKLLDNGNEIANSVTDKRYRDGFEVKCKRTGMYYFAIEIHPACKPTDFTCGYISVGFKRKNPITENTK